MFIIPNNKFVNPPISQPVHEYCVLASEVDDSHYRIEALVDSGSKISVMKESVLLRYFADKKINPIIDGVTYGGVNKSPLTIHGYVNITIRVHLLPHNSFDVKFAIVPDSTMIYDALLGRNFMMRPGLNVTFGLALQMSYVETKDDVMQIKLITENSKIDLIDESLITLDYHSRRQIVTSFQRFFSRRDIQPLQFQATLKLRSKVKFKEIKMPKLTQDQWQQIRHQINKLLVNKYIRPSKSKYVNPIKVKSTANKFTFYPDYSQLNEATSGYPSTAALFVNFSPQRLSTKSSFSCLFVQTDYNNIFLTETSTKYTSFATIDGQYEFMKMPIGLKHGSAIFQQYLGLILKELVVNNQVLLYSNQIIIATDTDQENIQIIDKVLNLLAVNGIALHLRQCYFLRREIQFMNYKIRKNTIIPGKRILGFIYDLGNFKTHNDLRRFYNLVKLFDDLIADFDKMTKPLVESLNGNCMLQSDSNNSIELLKRSLSEVPILSIYSAQAATEVVISADDCGFWSVLMQKQIDRKFHPVCYVGRKFLTSERQLGRSKLYALIINYTLQKLHTYLNHRPFTIVTDREIRSTNLKAKAKNYSFKTECRTFQLTRPSCDVR